MLPLAPFWFCTARRRMTATRLRRMLGHMSPSVHRSAACGRLLLIGLSLVLGWPQITRGIELTDCVITLIEEAAIPAQAAGVLTKLNAKEGDVVKQEYTLAQIDDRQARVQLKGAKLKLEVAQEQAKDDLEVRYQKLAAGVAKQQLQMVIRAREREANAISEAEFIQRELEHKRAVLAIDKAIRDGKVAGLNADVAKAEVEMANQEISIRQVLSPIDGEVNEILRHRGEWVAPGDPIMRIVRMDRLRVEGTIKTTDFAPHEVHGLPVEIRVELSPDEIHKTSGKISFVNAFVESTDDFHVWAEFDNKMVGQHFLVRPGMRASMTITPPPKKAR